MEAKIAKSSQNWMKFGWELTVISRENMPYSCRYIKHLVFVDLLWLTNYDLLIMSLLYYIRGDICSP